MQRRAFLRILAAALLDSGDTWQGSATSLWTQGADMIGAQRLVGVGRNPGLA